MKNTALITGASSGIGKELAYIHAQKGGNLVLVARSKGKLEAIQKDIKSKHDVSVKVIEKDLIRKESSQEIYNELKKEDIEIEYLINNAGFGGVGYFHERNLQEDINMIQLNIIALTELTHLFLPNFIERGSGKVLNVSSTASLVPGPLQAVYYATKAYVTSFSDAIGEELKETGVTVTSLLPGATETDFGKVSGMDKTDLFSHTASASTVAQDGYNAMIQGKRNVISGVTLFQRISLSLIPFLPKAMILNMIKKGQEIK